MQSLWRKSFHMSQLASSNMVHLKSSKVRTMSVHQELPAMVFTCERGTCRNLSEQSTGCRIYHSAVKHFSNFLMQQVSTSLVGKVSWRLYQRYGFKTSNPACIILENNLRNYMELAPSHGGISRFAIGGDNPPFRCMTTLSHLEAFNGEEGSATSSVPEHPQRIKFKRLDKTAKHIMNILDKEEVEKVNADRDFPDIRPGYIIQLRVEVPENKRRVSTIKGIVIARRNAGLHSTFRLRRLVDNVGVESVFPLYSPNIKEVKVVDKRRVRRAKLYYLRERMNPLKK